MKTAWSIAFAAAEVERLVEDLRRGEVATEPHLAGGAERASERAARLAREADRAPAVAVAHQDRFERAPVVGAQQHLLGAVAGPRLALEGEREERDLGGERGPETGRKVGHLVVRLRAPRHPLPDLESAKTGLAAIGEAAVEQLEVHVEQSRSGGAAPLKPHPRQSERAS
jgi:hypothetical protein